MLVSDLMPIISSLFDRGQKFVATPKGIESELAILPVLGTTAGMPLGTVEDLNAFVGKSDTFSTTSAARYLRLSDIEEGGCRLSPLVYIDGNFVEDSPWLRLQVILVVHPNAAHPNAKTFAIRFETPEGAGKHDYYHSQLCISIRRGRAGAMVDSSISSDIEWLPSSHPAWPMDAESPTQLLMCLVLALYGKTEGADIIRDACERSSPNRYTDLLGTMRALVKPKPSLPQVRNGARRNRRR